MGGHARRNEFEHDGEVLLATGGTVRMVQPDRYPLAAREMLEDIGVELDHPTSSVQRGMFRSMGLEPAVFFHEESFGKDALVTGSVRRPTEEFLARTPLTERVRADLLRLWNDARDYLPGLSREEKIQRLQRISYQDYLLDVVQVHPDVAAAGGRGLVFGRRYLERVVRPLSQPAGFPGARLRGSAGVTGPPGPRHRRLFPGRQLRHRADDRALVDTGGPTSGIDGERRAPANRLLEARRAALARASAAQQRRRPRAACRQSTAGLELGLPRDRDHLRPAVAKPTGCAARAVCWPATTP